MNAATAYHYFVSLVRQTELTERLFLASVELLLLALLAGLVAMAFRNRSPRLVAMLWIVVLAKPVLSLCCGSPLPLIEFATVQTKVQEIPVENSSVDTDFKERPISSRSINPFGSIAETRSLAATQAPCFKPSAIPVRSSKPAENVYVMGNVGVSGSAMSADNGAKLLILFWVAGVAITLCTLLTRYLRMKRIVTLAKIPNHNIQSWYLQICAELKVDNSPRLGITDQLDSPALAGLVSPVILIPQWLVEEGVHSKPLFWSIRHELNHWKVGDLFFNIVCGLTSCLFFFHPFVWWSIRRWRHSMELACDRDLICDESEASDYAEALYRVLASVSNNRRPRLANSMFATRTQIGQRIEVLLSKKTNFRARPTRPAITGLAVLSVLILVAGSGFADARPEEDTESKADSTSTETSRNESVQSNGSNSRRNGNPEKTFETNHVSVRYSGVHEDYARAVARVVETARNVAADEFGYAMPDSIVVALTVDPTSQVRLFNDGDRSFSLTLPSEEDLLRPSKSGKFHVYGLCHEVGHLAMYRPIQNRRWMTTAAAEGWAHYMGSHLVDKIYEIEGSELWPDPYDYRKDGVSRLEYQLASHSSTMTSMRPTTLGAGLWKQLGESVGHGTIADVFEAWGRADFTSVNLGDELGRLLEETTGDAGTRHWWSRANSVFVVQQSRSEFTKQTVAANQIRDEHELALDDGKSDGKKSIAGSGHAVKFQVTNDSSVLTDIRIHGARYGAAKAPNENFHVWLCDKEFNEIADFSFPFNKFQRGRDKWVSLKIKPTLVPREFVICVGFNPTRTKGVFVNRDGDASGASFTGLPGSAMQAFEDGDWLIRATIGTISAMREWSDASGKFSVEAEFLELVDNHVKLKKKNGTVVSVAVERLCDRDKEFLERSSQTDDKADDQSLNLVEEQIVLMTDDGDASGKRSFPQGFAVAFNVDDDESYLTSVQIHGARYGASRAPDEDFEISLCDEEFNLITQFKFPYSKFGKGEPKWISLPITPTKVPRKFVICANFNANRTKGVFVSHDSDGKGLMGKPGNPVGAFSGGDWLIRAEIKKATIR